MQSGGGPLQQGPPVMRGLTSGTPNSSQQQPEMQKMPSQPPLLNQQYQQPNIFRNAGTNQAARPQRQMVPAAYAPIYAPYYQMSFNPRMNQWQNFSSMPGMSFPPQYFVQQHIMPGQHQQNRRNPAGENNLVNVNSNYPAAPSNGGTNPLNPLTPIPQMPQVQLPQPQPNQQSSPMTVSHDMLVMQQLQPPQPQQTSQQVAGPGPTPMDHQPNPAQVNVGAPQSPHAIITQLQLAPHLAAASAAPTAKVNKKKQRGSRAIPIINPDTKEDLLDKIYNDSTPPTSSSSSSAATGGPPSQSNAATVSAATSAPSYNSIPPNVAPVPLNTAVETDYDNYTPHPQHQATPELAGPPVIGLMHHPPPHSLLHPPPPPSHPPPHVHPGHPGAPGGHPVSQGQMLLSQHEMGGRPQSVNSQPTHELVYSSSVGAIKIVNPPPHLPHHAVPTAAPEMTAGGTPVVSAIADGPSVEIKPYQKKKKPSEVIIQQPPPPQQSQPMQQHYQQHHPIDMQVAKSLPNNSNNNNSNSQQHLHRHNPPAAAGIAMAESIGEMAYPGPLQERYRTISEKSIAESTLSTDAEPFVYTGPSSQQQAPIISRVEETISAAPDLAVPFIPVAPAATTMMVDPADTFSPEPVVEVNPPNSSDITKALDSLVASVDKLSVADNSSNSSSSISASQTGNISSNKQKKHSKKRVEEPVASETSIISTSSSKAPATIVEPEQQQSAVDETDRSAVSAEAPQQQQSSSSLISNLVEHTSSKLDIDNIINNNNVECTSTTTTTIDNTTEKSSSTTAPLENAVQQQPDSRHHHAQLDGENNVQQPEFDDNKNVVVCGGGEESTMPPPATTTTTVHKQSSPVPEAEASAESDPLIDAQLAASAILPIKKSRSITRIEYDPDQWSPDNPDGKKKYSREQLMQLKNSAPSREKPVNLPSSLKNVLIRTNHGGSGHGMGGNQYVKNNFEISLMPQFAKDPLGGGGGMMGQMRPPYSTKRPSQQGNSGQGGSQSNKHSQQGMSKTGSKIIRLQLDEEVKLNECENAWRPRFLQTKDQNADVDRTATELLFKKFRSVLNKLTPENFDKLVEQVNSFVIDSDERLDGCIKLVFEKAVAEPNFSEAYAKMCKEVGNIAVLISNEKKSSFKGRLLAQCQTEFEKRRNDQTSAIRESRAKLEASKDLSKEDFEELKAQLEEKEQKVRRRAVGTVRFIGELFKHGQLTVNIMHNCITLLIDTEKDYDEETLECLCKLLTTIGCKMEKEKDETERMIQYFEKMENIVQHRNQYKISSRIGFMLQDVIDLRRNGWQPRRQDLNPKTMHQIVKEAETEQIQLNMSYAPRGKDSGYGGDSGRGGNRNMQGGGNKGFGMNMNQGYNQGSLGRGGSQGSMKGVGRMQTDDDGFQQIYNNRNNRPVAIDPKKINIPGQLDTTKLGYPALFQWKSNTNMFAALNSEDNSQGGGGGGSSSGGSMMDRDSDRDRDRDRSGSHRDRDRHRNMRDRDRDRDRSGSHNKNSGSKDTYHHNKGSMERDRYNRYGSSSSQNDDRMSRSSREQSSGGMRPMSGPHSNSQMHDRERDRERNMGKMSSQESALSGRSSQQRHIPQSAAPPSSVRMGSSSSGNSSALSKSGSGELYQQQQMPQFAIPKDAVRRNFQQPDDKTLNQLKKFSESVHLSMNDEDLNESLAKLDEINVERECKHAVVFQLLFDNIERDIKFREMATRAIELMFQKSMIVKADYLHALEETFAAADDLIIDIPQLFKYIATFYVTLLHQRFISLDDIRAVTLEVVNKYGASILKELLLQYEALYGVKATVMLWYESSSLKFNDFIKLDSNEQVEKFLVDAKLGYLLDSGNKDLDMKTVGAQIKQFLKRDAQFAEIYGWIAEFVGSERDTSDEFIRALTKAVIEHCIDNKTKLNVGEIQKWHIVLLKYIDNKHERELQAMYAIQRLVVELEHPQNLLHLILAELYEHDVITKGFALWKDSTDPLEAEGKGVCLKGITQFMTMYMENSSDEDN